MPKLEKVCQILRKSAKIRESVQKLKKEEKACLMLKYVLMAKDSTLIAFLDGVEVSPSTACCGEKHIRKQSYKRNF